MSRLSGENTVFRFTVTELALPPEHLRSLPTEAEQPSKRLNNRFDCIIATRCEAEMRLSFNCKLFIDFQKLELHCRIG